MQITNQLTTKFKQYTIYLKDWKFLYKLITFIILFLAFLLGIIYGVFIEFWYVSPKQGHVINIPRLYNLNVLISFWSVQTNFIVLCYFWLALCHHGRENQYRLSSFSTLLNVTTYLTLTMVLFWVLVFYGLGESSNVQKYHFASPMDEAVTVTTHSITPVLALGYLILNSGKIKITWKSFLWKNIIIMLLYPIGYLIFVNLRAGLLAADGQTTEFLFPYPFIDFYHPLITSNLLVNNILIVVIGLGMLIGLISVFVIFNNIYYQKRNLFLIKLKTKNLVP